MQSRIRLFSASSAEWLFPKELAYHRKLRAAPEA